MPAALEQREERARQRREAQGRRLPRLPSAGVTRRASVLAVLMAAIALIGTGAPAACADADPASDTLISGQDAFLPYQPEVSSALKVALTKVVADARRGGSVTQVALVASNLDLGAVPNFFGRPQEYARFLARELDAPRDWGLMVAMPQGLGYVGPSPLGAALRTRPVLATIAGHVNSDELARAAGRGVVDIARAAGHPLRDVPSDITGSGNGGGGSGLVVGGIVVALLLLAGGAGALRVRAGRGPAQSPAPGLGETPGGDTGARS